MTSSHADERSGDGGGVDIEALSAAGSHVCLIYDNEAERQEVVLRYIEAGIRAGERVAYYTESLSADDIRAWLQTRGVDVPAVGRFDVVPVEQVYFPDGAFSIDATLEKWRAFDRETVDAGYPAGRVTGETGWSRRVPGGDRIAEYCARLNGALAGSCVGALCQYDSRAFDGATLLDVLRVHPMILVGSQVVRNPYYLRPDDFLQKRGPAT